MAKFKIDDLEKQKQQLQALLIEELQQKLQALSIEELNGEVKKGIYSEDSIAKFQEICIWN